MRFLVDECTGTKVAAFLRLADERAKNKVSVLEALLRQHAERLPDAFTVVTENSVRFAAAG